MGYESGKGLGSKQQGITEPIQLQANLGQRGFGLNIKSLQATNECWDFPLEVYVKQKKNIY